jgi:photosystem II stability/assembly factor-like uncharacterized protein
MKGLGRVLLAAMAAIVLGSAAVPPARGQGEACPLHAGWVYLTPSEAPVALSSGPGFQGASAVAAGWTQSGILFSGGQQGLAQSTDCGNSWQPILLPLLPGAQDRSTYVVSSVAAGPNDRLYVGGTGSEPLLISADGGATWQGAPWLGTSVSASPASTDVVYAMSHRDNAGRGPAGVARSGDGGLTWELQNRYPAGAVAADALDPDIVYLGSGSCRFPADPPPCGWLDRSRDGGATFEHLANFASIVTAISMSPDGAYFWVATGDGQLHLSTDQGATWSAETGAPSTGSANVYVMSLSASPREPGLVFAVTSDRELWAYRTDFESSP